LGKESFSALRASLLDTFRTVHEWYIEEPGKSTPRAKKRTILEIERFHLQNPYSMRRDDEEIPTD
jgi:hypothetical protein